MAPWLPCRTLERGCTTLALQARRAQDRVIRPACWGFLNSDGAKVFDSVPPGLPVQGTFRCRCSDLWPRDQFSLARQLEEVLKNGATAGTFHGPPGLQSCTSQRNLKYFCDPV
eukprot:278984-Chlamydomonas_euryale.AAC.2